MMPGTRSAFLCSGQGQQLQGLGAGLLEQPELLRRAEALSAPAGADIPALLCGTVEPADTLAVHLALVSYTLLAYAQERAEGNGTGKPFALLAGHSLGELSALACAGALSEADAMRLAAVRGQAMAEACADGTGGMTALIGLPVAVMEQAVQDFLQDSNRSDLWIANYNSPEQLVLSGQKTALAACVPHMEKRGLRVVPLHTAGAFHSPRMARAAQTVFEFAGRLDWNEPTAVCLSAMTGKALAGRHFAAHCALQMVSPVRWLDVLEAMRRATITDVVEAGPSGTLGRFCAALPDWHVRIRHGIPAESPAVSH